ncbi:VanZ family protein [Streptomyces pharetrae]|uniref:VanZ family protein n=1 Tax=Streptomyces pharetrae TaxID=291370 RepID=UPI00345FC89A
MFTAIFQHRYGYLTVAAVIAAAVSVAAWLLTRRLGRPRGMWWALLSATVVGILAVTFMGAGAPSGECTINHEVAEPFHTTQGLWNLAMFVPAGFLAVAAARRLLPAAVGVLALPCVIELVQATGPGLGRICDSADAEMNMIGAVLGIAAAVVAFGSRGQIDWQGWAKGSLIAGAALLVAGYTAFTAGVTLIHTDGTTLSDASDKQRQAVKQAVEEAFGSHYGLGKVYEQPCVGRSCSNLIFTLVSRDGNKQAFSDGSLSWPDKQHLNILLENSNVLSGMGYPVKGAAVPRTEDEAFKVADTYMRQHYPWARAASRHITFAVGEKAELGWMTNWRFRHGGVLMPRMLDVQVDRAGRISQVDVRLGPTKMNLPSPRVSQEDAERAVIEGLASQARKFNAEPPQGIDAKVVEVKAEKREGRWSPEWLVAVGPKGKVSGDSAQKGAMDLWRVDALTGAVYDGIGVRVQG